MNQNIKPTPAGKLLYEYGCKILQIREEAIKAIEQFGKKLVGRITIGYGTIPGTYLLPPLLSSFRDNYHEIKTTLQIANSQSIAQKSMSHVMILLNNLL